jgi:hypothetical protein
VAKKEHNTKDEMEKKKQPASPKGVAGAGKHKIGDGNKEPSGGGEGQTGMQPGAGHPRGR